MIVLITGASSGYGLETARYFHDGAEEWLVVMAYGPGDGALSGDPEGVASVR